jgi:hypothetical protein
MEMGITLGRVPLGSKVTDDAYEDDENVDESKWHNHHPHTRKLPQQLSYDSTEWSWPTMFVYPSHRQSDFTSNFAESDMIVLRVAEAEKVIVVVC